MCACAFRSRATPHPTLPLKGGGNIRWERPSPLEAGESHMGLAGGLHFGANRILKVSLCLGDTDGSILRMLCGSSRPAVGQFQPRSDGDSVYRAAVVAVRRDELFGHGGVRLGQRAAAAVGPDV